MKWHNHLEKGWLTLKNYFKYRVTSALSEGQNKLIKMLKRRAFGYRNMLYFRLKIMQVCEYLNSRFVSLDFSGTYAFLRRGHYLCPPRLTVDSLNTRSQRISHLFKNLALVWLLLMRA